MVRNMKMAVAAAVALSSLTVDAQAADATLQQVMEQLQALSQRVERLEQQNSALQSENQQLKADADRQAAERDYLRAQTGDLRKQSAQASTEIDKLKGADWAARIAFKGDLRYRYEAIQDETLNSSGVQSTADRYRDRIRLRAGFDAKATDTITVGVQFATTEGGDPRSSNQTMTGVFSRKALDLDLAYFDWKFASWASLTGGKVKQSVIKPGGSGLFWDNDINPEGLAVTVNRGMWFGTAYSYWVNENSGAESASTSDTMLYGGQVGARLPLGASNLMLAAHYYDLSAGQGRSPFYNNSANGNTTVAGPNSTILLANDFEVIELMAEFNTQFGTLPFQVWADVAENQDPSDLNMAWGAGVLLGKASNYRTWELGAGYQVLEKDALFAQLIDSDFGGGVTDTEGWVFKAGYAPVRNWALNATYFLNKRNIDVANSVGDTDVNYDRLQLDFNVKF